MATQFKTSVKGSSMKLSLIISLLMIASQAFATGEKVVYGEDDRADVYESTNELFLKLATSTAAMIPNVAMRATGDRMQIAGQSMRERGFCAKERFSDQPTAARCSGFLVGANLLVTAGHCIKSQADCAGNKWVFDYKMENAGSTAISVEKSSVYSCKRIISTVLEGGNGNDYAIIELDRSVTGREPLKVRKSGKIAVGTEIVVIGHPTGLPTKITDGAKVRSLTSKYFVANLDTYGGNSGSAVFDAKTGIVEGILVRGENDYVQDPQLGCRVTNYCPENGCRGEDVTFITSVPNIP